MDYPYIGISLNKEHVVVFISENYNVTISAGVNGLKHAVEKNFKPHMDLEGRTFTPQSFDSLEQGIEDKVYLRCSSIENTLPLSFRTSILSKCLDNMGLEVCKEVVEDNKTVYYEEDKHPITLEYVIRKKS